MFDFFERLITDFSWRRLVLLSGVLLLAGFVFLAYESYTKTFALARMERQLALLERLVSLEEATRGSELSEQSLRSLDGIRSQLRESIEPGVVTGEIGGRWVSAFYTGIPWALLAVLVALSPGTGAQSAILGMVAFAVPLMVVNSSLPDFDREWINNWLIPWGEVAVVIVAILLWQKRQKR